MPEIGSQAPDFSLPDQNGEIRSVSASRGKWLLLYFYPKDMTPGCIKEACALRDDFPVFGDLDAQVFGISADSVSSHKRFAATYELPFPLLADVDKKTIEAYGAWGEKKFMGRTFMGIKRMSVLIDPEGLIRKIYQSVKPELHAKEVIEDIGKFSAS